MSGYTPEESKAIEEAMRQHGMGRIYQESDKEAICELLKNHATTNGYAQVGWAAVEIGEKMNRQFADQQHRNAFFKSVETLCKRDNKFISDPVPGDPHDFYIRVNPEYKEPLGFWSRNPFYEKLVIAIVAASLAFIASLTISQVNKQSQNLRNSQQDSATIVLGGSLSKLQIRVKDLEDRL